MGECSYWCIGVIGRMWYKDFLLIIRVIETEINYIVPQCICSFSTILIDCCCEHQAWVVLGLFIMDGTMEDIWKIQIPNPSIVNHGYNYTGFVGLKCVLLWLWFVTCWVLSVDWILFGYSRSINFLIWMKIPSSVLIDHFAFEGHACVIRCKLGESALASLSPICCRILSWSFLSRETL